MVLLSDGSVFMYKVEYCCENPFPVYTVSIIYGCCKKYVLFIDDSLISVWVFLSKELRKYSCFSQIFFI